MTTIANEVPGVQNAPPIIEKPKHMSTFNPALETFILKYKKGHEVISWNFQEESLAAAVKLGENYCSRKRYRFIVVTPLLRDLRKLMDQEEN